MISIDTNILIRLVTGDNQKQAAKAKTLFAKEQIYITRTVMLETEWVLRYAYEFKANNIADAFTKLLGQQNVTAEDAQHIAQAISLLRKDQATMGRYVYTDYDRCIGCHICAEVCPTGYIVMGMGG